MLDVSAAGSPHAVRFADRESGHAAALAQGVGERGRLRPVRQPPDMHPAQFQVGGNASIFQFAHAFQVAAGLENTDYLQQGYFPLAALGLDYALSIFPILISINYLHRIR